MAELSVQERLQPSLLDRLCDEDRSQTQESRDRRVMSLQQMREAVLRDLAWLLNTANLGVGLDTEDHPNIASSVLNYGMPPFAGKFAVGNDIHELEDLMRDAITVFEPRILPGSLYVQLNLNANQHNNNALTFDIQGELWAQPVPVRIFLRTEVDLEIGAIKVTESSGGR